MSPEPPARSRIVTATEGRCRVADLRRWCAEIGDRGVLVVLPEGHPPIAGSPDPGAHDALVTLRPAVDALVRVDEGGLVVGAVDRQRYADVTAPQVLRSAALRGAIAGADDGAEVDPGVAVLRSGGSLGELRQAL